MAKEWTESCLFSKQTNHFHKKRFIKRYNIYFKGQRICNKFKTLNSCPIFERNIKITSSVLNSIVHEDIDAVIKRKHLAGRLILQDNSSAVVCRVTFRTNNFKRDKHLRLKIVYITSKLYYSTWIRQKDQPQLCHVLSNFVIVFQQYVSKHTFNSIALTKIFNHFQADSKTMYKTLSKLPNV